MSQTAGTGPRSTGTHPVDRLYAESEASFERWEVVKDLVDELIDLSLNYRQSGHPGGSRSKVHLLRRDPPLGRHALGPPPTVAALRGPLRPVGRPHRSRSSTPPWLSSTSRCGRVTTCDRRPAFAFPDGGRWALTWEDLLGLAAPGRPARPRRDGRQDPLPQVQHGPVRPRHAAGRRRGARAQAGRRRRCQGLRRRGRGRPDPRRRHETKNSAWGLGLSNLVFLVDWNDFGIDDRPASSVVHGTPEDWFAPVRLACHRAPSSEWPGRRSPGSCSRPREARTRTGSRRWPGSRPARGAATASTTPRATGLPTR